MNLRSMGTLPAETHVLLVLHIRDAIPLPQIVAPENLAAAIQALQDARSAEGINTPCINRRRAPRADSAKRCVAHIDRVAQTGWPVAIS